MKRILKNKFNVELDIIEINKATSCLPETVTVVIKPWGHHTYQVRTSDLCWLSNGMDLNQDYHVPAWLVLRGHIRLAKAFAAIK